MAYELGVLNAHTSHAHNTPHITCSQHTSHAHSTSHHMLTTHHTSHAHNTPHITCSQHTSHAHSTSHHTSDIQTGNLLISTDNITIATSIDGSHLNEVHMCPRKLICIELNQLPGGTTEDYHTHIAKSINRIVSTYCAYFNQNYASVKKKSAFSHSVHYI